MRAGVRSTKTRVIPAMGLWNTFTPLHRAECEKTVKTSDPVLCVVYKGEEIW